MQERRIMRRFTLSLQGLVYLPAGDIKEEVHHVRTANVGAGGAYLLDLRPLPQGTAVRLKLILPRVAGVKGTLAGSCICLNAAVVRSDPAGMAVRFAGNYQILSITKLLAVNHAGQAYGDSQDRPDPLPEPGGAEQPVGAMAGRSPVRARQTPRPELLAAAAVME